MLSFRESNACTLGDVPWATDRSGQPLDQIEGWGIDGYDDVIALRARLKREPDTPEWSWDYIAPIGRPKRGDYYSAQREGLTALARRKIADSERRRAEFLRVLSQSRTIRQACETVGIKPATYTQWRTRYPDFRNKVDRIRHGLPETEDVNADFVSRRRYYFGYETYVHHQLILDAMEDTPEGGITMILLPPEAGKTQLLTDVICDCLAQDPNERILYVSEAAAGHSPAMKVLGAIKDRMTDPDYVDPDAQHPTHIPEWVNRFGPFRDDTLDRDKPWNQNYIKVHSAVGRRDWSFQACSWRSKVYGARCDKLIIDDVQSIGSLNLTEQIVNNLRLTFFTRPGKKGKTFIIGTRVGIGDVYERLVEVLPDEVLRVVQIPALDEDGNSYCPEMWPDDALNIKRMVVGEVIWATGYMMAPLSAGANTFTEEMLNEVRDPSRVYGKRLDVAVSLTLASLDPALGGGNALICAQTTQARFNVLAAKVSYGLARNEDILEHIRMLAYLRFSELVVERNSQQRGLARDQRLRDMAKLLGFKIVEHETGQNKWDFIFGVGAMASSFILREITFPDGDDESRRLMEPLRAELLAWRPNVDPKLLRQDLVMALWFGWLKWMERRKRVGQTTRWKVGGTPWKPGDMTGAWARNGRRSPLAVR